MLLPKFIARRALNVHNNGIERSKNVLKLSTERPRLTLFQYHAVVLTVSEIAQCTDERTGGALYSDGVYYVSLSTLFCYSVRSKEYNGILYVPFKLPRLALGLIEMYPLYCIVMLSRSCILTIP